MWHRGQPLKAQASFTMKSFNTYIIYCLFKFVAYTPMKKFNKITLVYILLVFHFQIKFFSQVRWDPLTNPHPRRKQQSTLIHFVGSVWRGNVEAFSSFAKGCEAEHVVIHRHGLNRLPHLHAKNVVDDHRDISDVEAESIRMSSPFVAAIQGETHISKDISDWSYIPDRALNAAALGVPFVTNNPSVTRLFFDYRDIVKYSDDVTKLCTMMKGNHAKKSRRTELREYVYNNHTFVSRFEDMLDMFLDQTSNTQRENKMIGEKWCTRIEH